MTQAKGPTSSTQVLIRLEFAQPVKLANRNLTSAYAFRPPRLLLKDPPHLCSHKSTTPALSLAQDSSSHKTTTQYRMTSSRSQAQYPSLTIWVTRSVWDYLFLEPQTNFLSTMIPSASKKCEVSSNPKYFCRGPIVLTFSSDSTPL